MSVATKLRLNVIMVATGAVYGVPTRENLAATQVRIPKAEIPEAFLKSLEGATPEKPILISVDCDENPEGEYSNFRNFAVAAS